MWRDVLNAHIQDVQQRQRIALALGVHPLTLVRWASNISTPRRLQYLRDLPDFMPEQREKVLQSILEEFPMLQETEYKEPTTIKAPPADINLRVLRILAAISPAMRFEVLCDTILAEAINILDPRNFGIALLVARCVPPALDQPGRPVQKVRSLLVSIARGTMPWEQHLDQSAIFLGIESLAGQAVSTLSPVMGKNLFDDVTCPDDGSYLGDLAHSVIAAPILHLGSIGGCVIALSSQPHSFSFLIQRDFKDIANLLALSFNPDVFYPPEQIELASLPAYSVQKAPLATYKQRLSRLLDSRDQSIHSSGYAQATQKVWSQIEKEVLQLPTICAEESERAITLNG